MSTTAPTNPTKPALSGRIKAGYILALILGLSDLANLASLGADEKPGESGPPAGVLIVGALLGVITVVAAVIAWRARSRPAVRVIVGSRILSLILSLPAFFVSGVPAGWVVLSAVFLVLTLVCVLLVLGKPSSVAAAGDSAVGSEVDTTRAGASS
jgi:hypothetical protein